VFDDEGYVTPSFQAGSTIGTAFRLPINAEAAPGVSDEDIAVARPAPGLTLPEEASETTPVSLAAPDDAAGAPE
jgi:hypothetical protein